VPHGAEIVEGDENRKLTLRFDRTITTASQVAAALMNQIEVADFSLAEPDLSSIVKQIYSGALRGELAA
jgi:ABC-2 type transport system ATP-binding protein